MPKTPIRRKSTHSKNAKIDASQPRGLPRESSRDQLVFQSSTPLHYSGCEETASSQGSTFKIKPLSLPHSAPFPRSLQSKPSTSTGFASLSTAYDSVDRAVAVAPAATTTWKQDSEIPLSDPPPASTSLKGAFLKMFSKTTSSEQNAANGSRSASRQSQRVSILLQSHIHITKPCLLTCSSSQRLQADLRVVLMTERMCCLTFTNPTPLLLRAGRACFARDVLLRPHCRQRSTLISASRKAAGRPCLCSRL